MTPSIEMRFDKVSDNAGDQPILFKDNPSLISDRLSSNYPVSDYYEETKETSRASEMQFEGIIRLQQ